MNIAPLQTGRRIRVKGQVQGVGFRPTVWRLAQKHKINGTVFNDSEGVLINAFGNDEHLDLFTADLRQKRPPLARIDSIHQHPIKASYIKDFHIIESESGVPHTNIVPDAASCPKCVSDSLDKGNHRYRYAFSNCTHCGPRLSIIKRVPYDRNNTSMQAFKMCPDCQGEYDDPADRRFHAQPNACPICGPKVFLSPSANTINALDDVERAAKLLQGGKILAIKGIGGFHLTCDATNENAVKRLRDNKRRYAKPFALMARDLDIISQYCAISEAEVTLLSSKQAPIVLLKKTRVRHLANSVAHSQSTYGFMLPYTPLHHLLLKQLEFPVVMTSGNVSEFPQIISNQKAEETLVDIADYLLINNRDIVNRIDDSVLRLINQKPQILRRARGYAPDSLPLPPGFKNCSELLALGAEMKNTFCLIKDDRAILSQHIGDLKNANSYDDYLKNIRLYQQLFDHDPKIIAIDKHPQYLSSKKGRVLAREQNKKLTEVQHHHAHIAACLADNDWPLDGGKVLGVAFDGLGYGDNNTIWGGEFLLADYAGYQRLGFLKPTPLLGNNQAMFEPWRNTYAQLKNTGEWQNIRKVFSQTQLLGFLNNQQLKTFDAMITHKTNTPLSSSAGRLFDAVAAAIGICQDRATYEGQAAIELEAITSEEVLQSENTFAYSFSLDSDEDGVILNPTPMWFELLNDLKADILITQIASRFHIGFAQAVVNMVKELTIKNNKCNTRTIALSGGVFQNKVFFELVARKLFEARYTLLNHSQVPANDGGIALGQAMVALALHLKNEKTKKCA